RGPGWCGTADLVRLIQVGPVEVVSMCDVDKRMLADAADAVAQRQASKHRPRTYSDYRKMLAEKDLDIVLIDTPDHWHALAMIAAVQAGADVWCQSPPGWTWFKARPLWPPPASTDPSGTVVPRRPPPPTSAERANNTCPTGRPG